MQKQKKGFTLIELLVVIAIIGILSAIGLVSLNGAREKARDAQRKSDLAQIRSALVLFYDDNNSKWPGMTTASGTVVQAVASCLTANLVTNYLQLMPTSPSSSTACSNSGTYYYGSSGQSAAGCANLSTDYILAAQLEGQTCKQAYILNSLGFGGTVAETTGNNVTVATCGGGSNNECVAAPPALP